MELKFKVQAKIQRPVAEVFDAVYNPTKLSAYFTTGSASAPLDDGATVTWAFADYPGSFPVHVKEMIPNKRIVIEWAAADGDYNTRVEMTFEALDARNTLVSISEGGWKDTEKGREASYGNCHGWTQMSCSLKAYVEHGINLREGFY
jgi:uncharacterized protein YndB with AHSA1/START domain